jgi:hypothetical protein
MYYLEEHFDTRSNVVTFSYSMETKSHLQLHNAADMLLSDIESSVKLTVFSSQAIHQVIENV